MFNLFYQEVKGDFDNSQLPLIFPNTALANLLSQTETPSPWTFFNAYYASWWWNRLSFRSGIQSRDALSYFDSVLNSLSYLKEEGIFNEANVSIFASYACNSDVLNNLFSLHRAGLLSAENFSLALGHNNSVNLNRAYSRLRRSNIFHLYDFYFFSIRSKPYDLIATASYLQQNGILTPDNSELLFAHSNPYVFGYALSFLKNFVTLTQENFAQIAALSDPISLLEALNDLNKAWILTQANYSALITPNHSALVSEEARRLIWDRIPIHFLTQANFERLLMASEHAHPMAELERVRDQIVGVQEHILPAHAAFNPGQSTHTSSVHHSVSVSAVKLMKNYGHDINLETKVQEIIAYVNGLDDRPQHQAAKRCIARITASDYAFSDSSGVSTRQLLGLAYAAIHDDTKRLGRLKDAKAILVEGLYEIQRGYNQDAQGHDQGGVDAPICSAGTFNKLMEKLKGIHKDVEVNYITHEGASSKFPKLAQAWALSYLKALASPKTVEEYCRVKDLLKAIQTDSSLELVWDNIKLSVQRELWDEFREAYHNDPLHVRFLELMDYGHQIVAPDLSAVESRLLASLGGRAYQYEQERLSLGKQRVLLALERHRLWSQRHESFARQNDFDKQYGLILRSR